MMTQVPDPLLAQGDQYGRVCVQFTPKALRMFLCMLNLNKVRDEQGNILTFRLHEYEPGKASLEVTITTPSEVT